MTRRIQKAAAAVLIACGFLGVSHGQSVVSSNPPQPERPPIVHVTGTFEVKLTPETPADKAAEKTLARMSIDKQFHGDLEGTRKGEMLSAAPDREPNRAARESSGAVVGFRVYKLLAVPAASSQAVSTAPLESRLLGTWRLVSIGSIRADGTLEPDPDLGPRAIGYLMYDPTRTHVCVTGKSQSSALGRSTEADYG